MSRRSEPLLDFDAPVESIDELVAYMRGGEKPPERWRVGTEHEKIGLHEGSRAPVPYEGERGIGALLEAVAQADGWERIREAGNVIALAKRRYNLSELKLEAEEEKYRSGVSTLADVVRFQRELDDSLLSYRQAQSQMLKAYARLRSAQGVLAGDMGIQVR